MRRSQRRLLGNVLVIAATLGLLLLAISAGRDFRQPAPPEDAGETCCSPGAKPRRAPNVSLPADLSGGDRSSGRALFIAACANCHDDDGSGHRGRGSYPAIQDLRTAPRDLPKLADVVIHGRGEMPAFGGLFEDAEVRDLLAFIQTFNIGT